MITAMMPRSSNVRGAVLAQRLQQGEVDDRAEQRALDVAKPPITTMKIA